MISNSGHDENGRYTGGKAGDQTGDEWAIREWYNRGWTVVLRHPDRVVGTTCAELATEAAQNDNIGYDQLDRYTFWAKLKDAGFHPAQIKAACEADCSAGVAAIVKAAGYLLNDEKLKNVSIYSYTGNLKTVLVNAGFKTITDKAYLTGDDYLLPGDILLCENHHVAINVSVGSKAEGAWYTTDLSTNADGLRVLTDLTLRIGPSKNYAEIKILKAGATIKEVVGKAFNSSDPWIKTADGWISAKHVEGWLKEPNGRWWYIQIGYSFPAYCVKRINKKDFIFDSEGWNVSADRIASDNSIMY